MTIDIFGVFDQIRLHLSSKMPSHSFWRQNISEEEDKVRQPKQNSANSNFTNHQIWEIQQNFTWKSEQIIFSR